MNNPLATLFEQFLRERTYLKNVTHWTIVWYEVAFKNYVAAADDPGALPTKTTLQEFVIRQRQRGLRPVTCNTYIGAMNAFCAWLHTEGHLPDRLKLSKLRVERRVLTLLDDIQIKTLIAFRPKTFAEWRIHVAVCLILDTGVRIAEALNVRHSDLDFDNLILKVFGKGQKERLVPFSPEMRKRLYLYQRVSTAKALRSDLLFAGFRGTRWDKRNSTTSLHRHLRKLGVRRFGWHRLRHTFATSYLRQGGDIVRLSIVLGHSQITTTQRYLHLLTDDLSASHQRVSILNRLA